jgi:diguanylate cyclase (GGDEF)-like protein
MTAPGTEARRAQGDGARSPEVDVPAGAPAARAGGERELSRGARLRDERADRRDQAARARDELAAGRDRAAEIEDQRALELEGVDGLWDRCTLGVRELRVRGIEGRKRAGDGRRRAKRDRGLAVVDRESGARDRQESKRDREYAATDELTGARRRGVGLEDLQREIDRARRTGETLVAAYVDVDGLKAVNDQHGHGAGDELLKDVVESLRREMRSYDLLVRLGGDEFLCVMPGVTVDQARQRFERLGSELPPGPTARSVSIGLVQLRDGEGPMAVVQRADQDLIAGRGER